MTSSCGFLLTCALTAPLQALGLLTATILIAIIVYKTGLSKHT